MRTLSRKFPRTLGALALGSACAAGELFAPPSPGGPPPREPVRVAATCGVGSPGQPMVGRFGLFAPPLGEAELPVAALACPDPPAKSDAKKAADKKPADPPQVEHRPHAHDPRACERPADTGDFSADAAFAPYDACGEAATYTGKHELPTQRPLLEWGEPFYGPGPTRVGGEEFGPTNLSLRKLVVFGDYRAAFAQNDLVGAENTVLAHRLNLDIDYALTATERLHAFVGPFQEENRFMRIEDGEFFNELDLFQADTDALFFEGDLGAMLGGLEHTYSAFDAPVTFGLVPLLFQNGVWALDTVVGGAVTIPAQNSPWLDWSNYDVTFFGGFDRVSTPAFDGDENAAGLVGVTTFVESRGGYLEAGYGYLDDRESGGRGYHNVGVSYTRRYANLVSNSVRVLFNAGQDRDSGQQTADGVLLLVENTFLTKNPYNVLPYFNVWAGFDRPQPLARAAVFGGVLFNTGILFQSDQLTGYPTLDSGANNTYGAALGVDLLAPGFDQQVIVEVAALGVMEERADRAAPGDQVGVGVRWQRKLTTATLIRADAMVGVLEDSDEVAGARIEYRWKF